MKGKIGVWYKLRRLLMSVIILSLLGLGSCKKCDDPCNIDCDNYDPCCGQSKADASFKIYELLGNGPNLERNGFEAKDVATDTIIFTNFARFRADYEADFYEWRVGTDPRVWNDREFTLRFGKPYYSPIEVRLKVYKKTDKNCFPNAGDTAEFIRKLYTAPKDSSKVLGHFEGYLENEPNKDNFFEIQSIRNQFNEIDYAIAGITPKCSTNGFDNGDLYTYIGYRSFYVSTEGTVIGCCHGLSAFGVVNSPNELSMDLGTYPLNPADTCSWSGLNDPYINDVFHGTKQ